MRKDGCDNRNLIPKIAWEERTNGAVDQATRQNRFIRWATFTLDETGAFDFTGGIHALFVLHAQREVARIFFCFTEGRRTEHERVAILNGTGAVGLLGEFADRDRERPTSELNGKFLRDHKGYVS